MKNPIMLKHIPNLNIINIIKLSIFKTFKTLNPE